MVCVDGEMAATGILCPVCGANVMDEDGCPVCDGGVSEPDIDQEFEIDESQITAQSQLLARDFLARMGISPGGLMTSKVYANLELFLASLPEKDVKIAGNEPGEPVGFDISPCMRNLKVLCMDCVVPADRGSIIRAGDEWGAWHAPCCVRCGKKLAITLVNPV